MSWSIIRGPSATVIQTTTSGSNDFILVQDELLNKDKTIKECDETLHKDSVQSSKVGDGKRMEICKDLQTCKFGQKITLQMGPQKVTCMRDLLTAAKRAGFQHMIQHVLQKLLRHEIFAQRHWNLQVARSHKGDTLFSHWMLRKDTSDSGWTFQIFIRTMGQFLISPHQLCQKEVPAEKCTKFCVVQYIVP